MFISRAYALSYITWIIFYDRDAKELVIMQPQLNMERLLSLIFVSERLKRVLSSKKQFSCRAFCLENFQNYIIGSCGCQAAAKSDGFLQKSIENTTIETNFKYLRPQTLITLSSIESCDSPPSPALSFHQDCCFPAKKRRTNALDTVTDKKVTILLAIKATEGSGFLLRLRNVEEKKLDFQRLQK